MVWGLLPEWLGEDAGLVRRITRADCKDGLRRFTLYVRSREHVDNLLRVWATRQHLRKRKGLFLRAHIPSNLRRPVAEKVVQEALRIVAWNIRGVNGKKNDLEDLAFEKKADIILLQETNRGSEHWPLRVGGFTVFESPMVAGDGGARGLAVCVRKQHPAFLTVMTANYLFVRLVAKSGSWLVGSVYLPHKGKAAVVADLAIALNRMHGKYPTDSVIIGGDLNIKVDRVRAEVLDKIPDCPC